ncbi:MAG: cyclic nucleotide-binding domain-containing protein, partial [Deltaproteobacteria bacterium]|nr:cyclic nucleotide-binding domain-containing protein [Deltaproteobacteria bacterium]
STLVKVLILLTLLPNVIIPILNYQFAYTVNSAFATQGGMLSFFGYFRGCMNIVSLIILLFVGRIYGRWGLPIVLMFHPFNYMLVFLAFLLRFDIFSAMYARVSTNVLRTTMNNPARAVLMGLFPLEYRAMIRPFLRGTVVRIGILLGSGIIMASEGLFSPRYLSIIAMTFVGGWIATSLALKKSYSQILLDLISRNMLDLKSLEEKDVGSVFADKQIQSGLVKTFLSSRGDDCLWHARILKSQGVKDLDAHILTVLKQNDDKTRIELLSMLSPEAGEQSIPLFRELVAAENRDLTVAVVKAANRLPAGLSHNFCKEVFETSQDPDVKAYAVIGLYNKSPDEYKGIIDSWLSSDDLSEKRAGIIASGESANESYISRLKDMLEEEEESSIIPFILTALDRLKAPEPNSFVTPYLTHSAEPVRLAALEAFDLKDDDAIRTVIALMDDISEKVYMLAQEKIKTSPYQNAQILVESLNIPRRKVREGIFVLLESLNIKDLDMFRFARSQVERCYNYLAEMEGLRHLPEGQERDLIIDHLENKKHIELENIVRVLATEDRSGQMRIIWRGLFSTDARQRSNLLEGIPPSETLKTGMKNFKLPDFSSDKGTVCPHLLGEKDWVTVVLTLFLISKQGSDGIDMGKVQAFTESDNAFIRQMALCAIDMGHHDPGKMEDNMKTEISIPDKILRLKGINIFEGLSVSELAAIASVTEEVDYPGGEIVIREGESGETMFLIIKGEVSVIKGAGEEGEREIELARIGTGDYFGEMALFEDAVRSATIRTAEEARFLILHKQEFTEIVREYPQIALHICKALSGRIRELHEKIKG